MIKGVKRVAIVMTAAIFLAVGFAAAWKFRPKPETYTVARSRFVVRLAHQFGQADTVIFGDSLTEETDFTNACGRTFAAGVGGARPVDIAAIAPGVLTATKPKLIVLEGGTNHFTAGPELALMRREYPALAKQLKARAPLILVGIGNSADGDEVVRRTAVALSVPYVAPVTEPGLITDDGVHHTPDGSRMYRARVVEACGRLLKET